MSDQFWNIVYLQYLFLQINSLYSEKDALNTSKDTVETVTKIYTF